MVSQLSSIAAATDDADVLGYVPKTAIRLPTTFGAGTAITVLLLNPFAHHPVSATKHKRLVSASSKYSLCIELSQGENSSYEADPNVTHTV
jgi:hypothetical protein